MHLMFCFFHFIPLFFRPFNVFHFSSPHIFPLCSFSCPFSPYWSVSFNNFIIPSSCRSFKESCPVSRVPLKNGTTPQLSGNLVMFPGQYNFRFRYSAITSFTPLLSRFTWLRICSRNDIPCMDISKALYTTTNLFFFHPLRRCKKNVLESLSSALLIV